MQTEGADNGMVGRHALITGAGSGIGRATAQLLAERGAKVAMLDVDPAGLEDTAKLVPGSVPIAVDLLDLPAARRAVVTAVQALGTLDCVVNCAGIAAARSLADCDEAFWNRILAINLTAPYVICQEALPYLRANRGASIVNVISAVAFLPNRRGTIAYATSKSGLMGLTRSLASDLAPDIRVNGVAPGIVNTAMGKQLFGDVADPDDSPVVEQYALRRVARPREIAEAIGFLASEAASYVTGSILSVDGGRVFH